MSTASGYRDRIEPGVEDEMEFAEEGARGEDAQTHEIDGISTEEAGGKVSPVVTSTNRARLSITRRCRWDDNRTGSITATGAQRRDGSIRTALCYSTTRGDSSEQVMPSPV